MASPVDHLTRIYADHDISISGEESRITAALKVTREAIAQEAAFLRLRSRDISRDLAA